MKCSRKKGKLSWAEIEKLYETHSVNQIAAIDGTSYGCLVKGLHRLGVKMRPRGSAGRLGPAPTKHGFYCRDILPGASPIRQLRWLAVKKLGGICCGCKNSDLRVLQINHVNGASRPKKNKHGGRCQKATRNQLIAIIKGDLKDGVDVRCANCNIIHEYERGKIKDIYAPN